MNIKSMKFFYLLFLLTCCNFYTDSTSANSNPLMKKEVEINKQIIGKWKIYHKILKGVVYSCYNCPEVYFDSDGKAKTYNAKFKLSDIFEWEIQKDTLFIRNKQYERSTFNDNSYLINFVAQNKYDEIIIKDFKNESIFYLRR